MPGGCQAAITRQIHPARPVVKRHRPGSAWPVRTSVWCSIPVFPPGPPSPPCPWSSRSTTARERTSPPPGSARPARRRGTRRSHWRPTSGPAKESIVLSSQAGYTPMRTTKTSRAPSAAISTGPRSGNACHRAVALDAVDVVMMGITLNPIFPAAEENRLLRPSHIGHHGRAVQRQGARLLEDLGRIPERRNAVSRTTECAFAGALQKNERPAEPVGLAGLFTRDARRQKRNRTPACSR